MPPVAWSPALFSPGLAMHAIACSRGHIQPPLELRGLPRRDGSAQGITPDVSYQIGRTYSGGAGLIARTMRMTQTNAKVCQQQPQSAAELHGQPRCRTPKRLEFIFGHNGVNEG